MSSIFKFLKPIRYFVKKDTTNNIKMTGKQYVKKKEKTYYLVCKKATDNKKIGQ